MIFLWINHLEKAAILKMYVCMQTRIPPEVIIFTIPHPVRLLKSGVIYVDEKPKNPHTRKFVSAL